MKKLRRLLLYASMAISAAAVFEQMRRPAAERTWHGAILGVPYDFRPPSLRRFREAWWNPDDERLFTPRDFGVGWAVNLHRLLEIATAASKRAGEE